MDNPLIFTKKWLCCRLGYSIRSNSRNERLRKHVFTDTVLEKIGMTEDEYKQRRVFTREESIRIKEVLCL